MNLRRSSITRHIALKEKNCYLQRIVFTSRHQHLDLQQKKFVCSVIRSFMETLDKVMNMWQLKGNSICIKMQKIAVYMSFSKIGIFALLNVHSTAPFLCFWYRLLLRLFYNRSCSFVRMTDYVYMHRCFHNPRQS